MVFLVLFENLFLFKPQMLQTLNQVCCMESNKICNTAVASFVLRICFYLHNTLIKLGFLPNSGYHERR